MKTVISQLSMDPLNVIRRVRGGNRSKIPVVDEVDGEELGCPVVLVEAVVLVEVPLDPDVVLPLDEEVVEEVAEVVEEEVDVEGVDEEVTTLSVSSRLVAGVLLLVAEEEGSVVSVDSKEVSTVSCDND